ncbi:Cysteine proteinase [Thalictrum thalictroides]|uniref:Cysteine proteinase n=1 Tax=Thalictrum thalictroides TaxID=46969 RepID=A0A7J6WVU0_THATH|nr:Cysteine proteinase [Thalictrum thalictroides]
MTLRLLPLFLVISSTLLYAIAFTHSSEDLVIQQVVDEDEDEDVIIDNNDSDLILNANHHFTNFITKFGKTYKDEAEHAYRFSCDPVDRDVCDGGCNGGLMNTALEYTLKAGGLQREEDYPYTGKDGKCKFDKTKIAASVANFSIVSLNEDQIAANLVKNGPLAVGINAAYMQTYIKGVSCPYICSKHNIDHAILLVGYGSGYAPIRLKDKEYWVLKNSWGESWGEEGYYKICRGYNTCGVDSMVSTVAAIHTTPQ